MTTDIATVTAEGYLSFMPVHSAVPPAFWTRIREKATADGLWDEFQAEYRAQKVKVLDHRTRDLWWSASDEMELEQLMFRRWVLRLFGEPALWPWQRGWTKSALAQYLNAP